MAIHELASNAAKYGSLSVSTGRLAICWVVTDGPDPRLRLSWTETGGPPVAGPPSKRGFGTTLIERSLGYEFGADVDRNFARSGVVCIIDLPFTSAVGELRSPLLSAGWMTVPRTAKGCKVLVVEDEMMIVLVIEETLLELGALIVGPAARLDAAIELAKNASIDAAILDVNIHGGKSYAVADILAARRVPFIFCSGYSDWALEERHRDRPRLAKPYSIKDLEERVLQLLNPSTH